MYPTCILSVSILHKLSMYPHAVIIHVSYMYLICSYPTFLLHVSSRLDYPRILHACYVYLSYTIHASSRLYSGRVKRASHLHLVVWVLEHLHSHSHTSLSTGFVWCAAPGTCSAPRCTVSACRTGSAVRDDNPISCLNKLYYCCICHYFLVITAPALGAL